MLKNTLTNTTSNVISSSNAALTEATIVDWLILHLSEALNIDADEIETEEPFSSYGVDSSVLLMLTGDLADWLARPLEPTLFWEYPNIATLTAYLMESIQQ